jgi:hypothetical protein
MKARFFRTPAQFRAWLRQHHGRAGELLVGFHKRSSARPSLTWPESVAEAAVLWLDRRRAPAPG